jgi:hypothetical protein
MTIYEGGNRKDDEWVRRSRRIELARTYLLMHCGGRHGNSEPQFLAGEKASMIALSIDRQTAGLQS